MLLAFLAIVAAVPSTSGTSATFPPHLTGSTDAVYALLERILPGSSSHFEFVIDANVSCQNQNRFNNAAGATTTAAAACFTLQDGAAGAPRIRIEGTTASELTGGLGVYIREWCNITVGWRRGGGSNVFTPSPWRVTESCVCSALSINTATRGGSARKIAAAVRTPYSA